ncbi:MAG: hypothetical protein U0U70_01875 [Chitinophagaceae bacterium]
MDNNSSKKIRETLNNLKDDLNNIGGLRRQPCNSNMQEIFHKIYSGTAKLESLYHISNEYTNEIIELHSQYVNKSFEIFGDYHGWKPE